MFPAQPGDTALDLLLRFVPTLWCWLFLAMLGGGILSELMASWETRQWIDEAILWPIGVAWMLLMTPAMVARHFLRQRRIGRGAPPP